MTSVNSLYFKAAVSLSNSTLPTQAGGSGLGTDPIAQDLTKTSAYTGVKTLSVPPVRLSIAATTTVYLLGSSSFSAGGVVKGYGSIRSRRMR